LISSQLARLNGATVIAVDGIDRRLELAGDLGSTHVVDFALKESRLSIDQASRRRPVGGYARVLRLGSTE
jgi:threonine dehydrogenase-like Zn-dependent dehydrogenase